MDQSGYQDDLLQAFVGQYARLCHLVARAIVQGHAESHVVAAAMGSGSTQSAPVYVELREQQKRTYRALQRVSDAHVPAVDVERAASDAKRLAGEEWMIEFPSFAANR